MNALFQCHNHHLLYFSKSVFCALFIFMMMIMIIFPLKSISLYFSLELFNFYYKIQWLLLEKPAP